VVDRADAALWVRCEADARRTRTPDARLEAYFVYLETFPTGAHNRRAAEAIEALILELRDPGARAAQERRLRTLRDRYMPAVEANSWGGPLED